MAKRWKKEDITYLKRYAKKRRLDELAKRFRTDTKTVHKKLSELGLEAQDGVPAGPIVDEALIEIFEQALKTLQRHKWEEALAMFEQAAKESDQSDFANRARRYAEVCRDKLQKEPPSTSEDPFLQAVIERNRGNFDEALDLCARGGRQGKDERFTYLAASVHSVTGEHKKAAELLAQAIALNPKNRIHAYHDSDFDELRANSEFKNLFEQP